MCIHYSNVKSVPMFLEKEECAHCFHTTKCPGGLNVCLECFSSFCTSHSQEHTKHTKHGCSLNIQHLCSYPEITKLEIKKEQEIEVRTSINCFLCQISYPVPESQESFVNDVISASSSSNKQQIKAWELQMESCEHVVMLGGLSPLDKKLNMSNLQCFDCNATENLWVCFTCASVGCGRSQAGGQKGNGHALSHFDKTQHAVAFKVGTITPDGADIFCYCCGDERLDFELEMHLHRLGISLSEMKKSVKSLVELQIEENKKFEFSMKTEDGMDLVPVHGPWKVGLQNLGNSCYFAVCIQLLLSLDEFKKPPIPHFCNRPADCLHCQWRKLVLAFEKGKDYVNPRLLKKALCEGNQDFSSFQQQDAVEFLSHVFKKFLLQSQIFPDECYQGSSLFNYSTIQQIECLNCKKINYTESESSMFIINITKNTSLKEHLESTKFEYIDYHCEHCNHNKAKKSFGINLFPKYLLLICHRFGNKETKLDVDLQMDDLDLNFLKMEKKGEKVDSKEVKQLMEFGVQRDAAIHALEQCNNKVEEALNFTMDNVYSESATMLISMGFEYSEAMIGLKQTNGDLERAVDYLFSRKKNIQGYEHGKYNLICFINHKGPSPHCGHYICHKKDQDWILMNDEKVVVNNNDLQKKAYLYLLKIE